MNTSNSFRPNFLLDFENGEAYFGAGGIHLAADSENSQLQLTTADTKLTLDGSGLSMINNTSGLSTVGTYIKKIIYPSLQVIISLNQIQLVCVWVRLSLHLLSGLV